MPEYGPISGAAPGIVAALKAQLPNNDIREFNGSVDGETLKNFTMSIRPAPDDTTTSALAALRVCVLKAQCDGYDDGLGQYETQAAMWVTWAVFIAARGLIAPDAQEPVTAHKVAAWHAELVIKLALSNNGLWGFEKGCAELTDLGSITAQNLATTSVFNRRILESSRLALWVVTGRQRIGLLKGLPDPATLPDFVKYEGDIVDKLLAPDEEPEIAISVEIDQS